MIFLLLFSYVLLCDFYPLYKFKLDLEEDLCLTGSAESHLRRWSINSSEGMNGSVNSEPSLIPRSHPSGAEFALIFWMITLFFEEIRQILSIELPNLSGKIRGYFSIFWNKMDVLSVLLFFVALILRYYPSKDCFCAARILLGIDLSIWYIRTLDIFSAIKQLGPKLVMIGEMVNITERERDEKKFAICLFEVHDMKFFMLMLTVFILAFGVPAHSLIYGVEEFTWHLPRDIFNIAYYQIFGELEILDKIARDYKLSGYVLFVLHSLYLTVANVLLINLLIAMFSNTFDRLQADADCIWKFQHYSLVCYHLTRPCLPPPLIFLSHIWRTILYFFSSYGDIQWFKIKYLEHKNKEKFRK